MPPYGAFWSSPIWVTLFSLAVAWSAVWKGIALWRAGRNGSLIWFIVLLVVNTLGILEIIYIFGFSRKKAAKSAA